MHKTVWVALLAAITWGSAWADGPDVGVTAQRLTVAQYNRLQDVEGRYRMVDGRQMKVVRRGADVMAKLDGEAPAFLRGKDMQSLRSRDGRMEMRFVPNAYGDDLDVVVTLYGPNRKVAEVLTSKPGG